ncbi:MAG: type II toxin-antitoxin system VapC family toxin [Chloroflexi bacterium]|nr:type II toxin-antitoxin system VapC family toxin [Chloroflexota bacterium]
MNIVVDSSVIISVIANGTEKVNIISRTMGFNLVAPSSVHWEIGNAFSAMLKRKRITQKQAIKAIQIYKSIPIRFVEINLEEALEIADQLQIYAYEAYLIQCALSYQLPLMTLDKNLEFNAKQKGVRLVEVNYHA